MEYHLMRTAVRDWIAGYDWGEGIAVTLTFPPSVAAVREAVDDELKHYWNRVDDTVFGNLSRRRKRAYRVQRVCCIEAGANRENHHCHAMVKVPTHGYANSPYDCATAMQGLLEEIWMKEMTFNIAQPVSPHEIVAIENAQVGEETWQAYMTKKITDWNADVLCSKTTWLADGQADAVTA